MAINRPWGTAPTAKFYLVLQDIRTKDIGSRVGDVILHGTDIKGLGPELNGQPSLDRFVALAPG